jgi:DNA primase
MVADLRPVFATLPPSAMRMELTRLVSGRLGLSESLAETLLAAKAEPRRSPSEGRSGGSPEIRVLSGREDTERAFLAQCIAAPEHGRRALEEVEIAEVLTSEVLRRAAKHLLDGHLKEPLKGVDDEDRELVSLLAELTVEAGRWPVAEGTSRPAMLEVQQLQLQLASIDRRIHTARAQGTGEVSDLARLKSDLKQRFDRAQERAMAHSGARVES